MTAVSPGSITPDTSQPVKKREIFGWAMYDFANSSYTTVVVTFVYASFFVGSIVPAESMWRDSYWSVAMGLSTALTIVLAPFLGAICDITGYRKRYLFVCTLASVGFTAALALVNPGQVWLGIAFLVVSNTAWMVSESFNASFLKELSTDKNIGSVSGIGWGIGYLGGLLSIATALFVITADKGTDQFIAQNQMEMVVIALFYAIFTIPTFLLVKERNLPTEFATQLSIKQLLSAGFTKVWQMRELLKTYPQLFRFFIPFVIYSAGIAIVIKFFGIYASQEIGITGTDFFLTGVVLQISSMIGAIVFGFIQDRLGAKTSIQTTLVWWMIGILLIYFMDPLSQLIQMDRILLFKVLAFVAGSALGATQSASRALVGSLGKTEDSALIFGLWGTFGRLGIILGMVFGPISDLVGRHDALLVILLFFVVGSIVLAFMDIEKSSEG